MGGRARFRLGIALSAIGEGLREAARDFGGASLRCVCLPLSPAGSGHPPHRFITPSRRRNTTLPLTSIRFVDLRSSVVDPTDLEHGWYSYCCPPRKSPRAPRDSVAHRGR